MGHGLASERERVAPSRRVIEQAEATHRALGHENWGFLSVEAGFMPRLAPVRRLPAAFALWDQIAAELPRLYDTLGLRRTLGAMPNLGALVADLPETALLRASNVLAILSHAFQYVECEPPAALPAALAEPWAAVRLRLERPDAVLSYIDLIVYNFRLLDARAPDPYRVENMRLLTPTVDTDEERVFYLTQTEILAQTSPVLGAIVRAQQAVLEHDPRALARELELLLERLMHVVRVSLLKINPNPAAPHFVDPVVWAKTVAPFAVPIQKGVQGPSGTSSPLFNLLDAFFGRRRHDSFLGREIRDLRRAYPRFWREFLSAVSEVSTADFVARSKRPELEQLWSEAMAAYVGPDGFLGRHRMKVYGYLELAFKVGRSVTIGGFSGVFKDRTWDQVDAELEHARSERLESFPEACQLVEVKRSETSPSDSVRRVLLRVEGAALRYEPGDRCGVLAENDSELVARTLGALGATGEEPIELTPEWLTHLRLRPGFAGAERLALRDLLRFGRIRPVIPRVAEALHAVTQHPALQRAILEQTTSNWELWDLLLELGASGFDVRRLWQRPSGSSEYIARVVPPENFRMYSISSAMPAGESRADSLELTVGLVRYRPLSSARAPELVRRGTASNFLGAGAESRAGVPVVIQHPARFGLPSDARAPLLMIAGGTGIAPFLSFIRRRCASPDSGDCVLFWGLRSAADFVYEAELARAVAAGKLELHVAFSREAVALHFVADGAGAGHFEFRPGVACRVNDVLLDPSQRAALERALASRAEGGLGAYVYTCGRSGFARSVDAAFHSILARAHDYSDTRAVDRHLARLAGEGRYLREIYSDPRPATRDEPSFDVSEIVTRNSDAAGHWLVIDAKVYDLSSFLGMHPVGIKVLYGYAGMDATEGYLRAHRRATDVDAMRDVYAIGKVRPLELSGQSRVVERDGVTHRTSLAMLHRAWVSFTYLAVEMQNALRSDLGFKDAVTARGEPVEPRSPYKIERSIETLERFLKSYTTVLSGNPAVNLWDLAEGMQRGKSSGFMQAAVAHVHASAAAKFAAALPAELRLELRALRDADPSEERARRDRLLTTCELLEASAEAFLRDAKSLLREGLLLFERYEATVLEQAGERLLRILGGLPDALSACLFEMQKRLHVLGYRWALEREPSEPSQLQLSRPLVVAANRYWLLEWDEQREVAWLRRSAEPLLGLADLVAENERILAALRGVTCRGVVVDTRQAPLRNDPEFEHAMRGMRHEICRRYGRVAVLLATAVGVLQVARLGREDDATTLVTHSEDAATKFAIGAS